MDIPVPKFRVGQTVFYPTTEREQKRHACPDCNDTGKWKCQNAHGDQHQIGCPRCGYTHGNRLPDLRYTVHAPKVETRVISGLAINTDADQARDRIEYRSKVSNCQHYIMREDEVFESHEAALKVAQLKADKANAEESQTPERIEQNVVSFMTFQLAENELAKKTVWNSTYNYHRIYREMKAFLSGTREDSAITMDEDDRARMLEALEDDKKFGEPQPLSLLLHAIDSGDPEKIKFARAKFPNEWADLGQPYLDPYGRPNA